VPTKALRFASALAALNDRAFAPAVLLALKWGGFCAKL
jgi:hypothetical protein